MIKYGLEGDAAAIFAHGLVDHHTRLRVFNENHREFLDAIGGFTMDLWPEERATEYHAQRALVGRRVFNWLASAHSLVDCTRRLIGAPPFDQADQRGANDVLDSEIASFIDELRHVSIHDILPFMGAYSTAYSSRRTEASLNWLKQQLVGIFEGRAKGGRNPKAQRALHFLDGQEDLIDVRVVANSYHASLVGYLARVRTRLEALSPDAAEVLAGADKPEAIHLSPETKAKIRLAGE